MSVVVTMSQAEYARHRSVSRQMVGKWISSEKIPASALTDDQPKKIKVAAADLALGTTIERVVAREDGENSRDVAGGDDGGAGGGPASGLTKAKTASAFYQANLARLQYEEKIGKLVSRADVELSMQRAAEIMGRDIDQIATRADDVATAFTRGGVDEVRACLKKLARDIRANLAANMRLLEQSEADAEDGDDEDQAA